MSSTPYSPLPGPSGAAPAQASRFTLPLPWRSQQSQAAISSSTTTTTTTTSRFDAPTFLQAVTARPLRAAAWAFGLFVLLLVVVPFRHASPVSAGARIGEYASENFWALRPPSSSTWRQLPANEGLQDPPMVKDESTGNLVAPDVYPAALNPFKRANAALVTLVRNREKDQIRDSMRSVEAKFNRKFGYPWVMLNDEPFTDDFKKGVLAMTRSEVVFAQIPKEDWEDPSWVNQTLAAQERQKMVNDKVIYGGSTSYRKMCRFNSGFFYRQKVLEKYDFYWRVEPGIELKCDVDTDPFLFMDANNKVYGFTIAMYEYERTIQTLWESVKEFARIHPEHIAQDNAMHFMVDNTSEGLQGSRYNLCHFWSNFEIADMRFWRSKAYSDFFDFLDKKGGFFYERWGDAPVHSIAAALMLPRDKIHHFSDIGYRHNPYTYCPADEAFHSTGRCECEASESFTRDGYACYNQWWRVGPKPPGE